GPRESLDRPAMACAGNDVLAGAAGGLPPGHARARRLGSGRVRGGVCRRPETRRVGPIRYLDRSYRPARLVSGGGHAAIAVVRVSALRSGARPSASGSPAAVESRFSRPTTARPLGQPAWVGRRGGGARFAVRTA